MTAAYGTDAPGVIRGFLLAAAGLALAGFAATVFAPGLATAGSLLRVAALVPLALAATMLAYAWRGKFRMRDAMLDTIPWRGDEAVLDVGSGRGLLAIGAARRLTTGHATGIDIFAVKDLSGNTIDAAAANARAEGVADRVTFLVQDASAMAFADATFDVVLSLLCLHNIPEPGRTEACANIARVLKPGGTALIADYVPVHGYARVFAACGLSVTPPVARFGTALGPMWFVRATKLQPSA